MKFYEYMIVYQFRDNRGNGTGRCFITRECKINTQSDIESIEKAILEKDSFLQVGVIDFKLLREY